LENFKFPRDFGTHPKDFYEKFRFGVESEQLNTVRSLLEFPDSPPKKQNIPSPSFRKKSLSPLIFPLNN